MHCYEDTKPNNKRTNFRQNNGQQMEVDDIFLGANDATFRDSMSTLCGNDAESSCDSSLLEGVCDLSIEDASFSVIGGDMEQNHC